MAHQTTKLSTFMSCRTYKHIANSFFRAKIIEYKGKKNTTKNTMIFNFLKVTTFFQQNWIVTSLKLKYYQFSLFSTAIHPFNKPPKKQTIHKKGKQIFKKDF